MQTLELILEKGSFIHNHRVHGTDLKDKAYPCLTSGRVGVICLPRPHFVFYDQTSKINPSSFVRFLLTALFPHFTTSVLKYAHSYPVYTIGILSSILIRTRNRESRRFPELKTPLKAAYCATPNVLSNINPTDYP